MAAQLAAEFPATNAGWTATIDRFAFHREMRRLVEGRAQGLRVLETFRKPGISIGGIDTPTTCKNHRMRLTVFSISRSNNHSTLPSTGRSPPNALPLADAQLDVACRALPCADVATIATSSGGPRGR
jgi:hypothetical protein